MAGLSNEELHESAALFKLFDADKSNTINLRELSTLCRGMGAVITNERLKIIFDECDLDKCGALSLEQLQSAYKVIKDECSTDETLVELSSLFRMLDKQGKGYLNAAELKTLLQSKGEPLTDEEAADIFSSTDLSGDGKIDLDEFLVMMGIEVCAIEPTPPGRTAQQSKSVGAMQSLNEVIDAIRQTRDADLDDLMAALVNEYRTRGIQLPMRMGDESQQAVAGFSAFEEAELKLKIDYSCKPVSLAYLALFYNAPMVLISSPEFGPDDKQPGIYETPVMSICENLPKHLESNEEFEPQFSIAVDFQASTSSRFCSSRVHGVNLDGSLQVGEDDFHRRFHPEEKEMDLRRAILNSYWVCFWRGKVSGALSTAMISGARSTFINQERHSGSSDGKPAGLDTSFGHLPPCMEMGPGWSLNMSPRVIVAISIEGGPVTQVERELIPGICVDTISDLKRRGFSWGKYARIIWCHFPTVADLVHSLDGEVALVPSLGSPERPKQYVQSFSIDRSVVGDRTPTPSILWNSVESAMSDTKPFDEGVFQQVAIDGDTEAVRFIMEKRGDPNYNNTVANYSMLHYASCHDYTEMAKVLIKYRADVKQENEHAKTPMDMAQSDDMREILESAM